MRKTILLMSLFAAAFYAANATAETIEFQGKVGANAYYADAINWIGEVAPTIDDDVVLDNSKLLDTKTHDLNLNVDGQAGSLTIIDNAANQISSVNGPKTFQIAGNLTRLEKNKTGTWFSINSGGIWTGATTPVGDAPLDLIIGGKVVVGEAADTQVAGSLPKTGGGMQFGGTGSPDSEASWSRALNSLRITGDIELYYTSTFILNVYNRNRNSSVENPDAIIGGVVKLIGTESTGDSSTS